MLAPSSPPVLTSVRTTARLVALTIDDGPHPVTTPLLLDVLERHGATATFFLIGERAAAHPELVRSVVAAGHEVGNHLWRDQPSWRLPPARFREELTTTSQALGPAGVVSVFRPGSGAFTPRMLRDAARLGHRCVLGSPWLVATSYSPDPFARGRRLAQRAHPGAIAVVHEGTAEREPVATAVDGLLSALHDVRLHAVTVSELVQAAQH